MKSIKILVTGGAGYIGSTICSALLDSGAIPLIVDDLSSGPIEHIGQRIFYKGDFADKAVLKRIHAEHSIDGVIHCAAKIKVSESVSNPFEYYECNVSKSITFLKNLVELKISNLVFSSTAALYASRASGEVDESGAIAPQSPYAKSKYMIEQVIDDYRQAYSLNSIILRYFNVIGADPTLRSGPYDPNPSHILGKLMTVYTGKEDQFVITGTQWPTRDGSGIRDYIHVWDLALAHVAAIGLLQFKDPQERYGEIFNLGTGRGVTVKEFVHAFEEAVGISVKVSSSEARVGDVAGSYTKIDKAKRLLNWSPTLSIAEAIRHSVEWDRYSMMADKKLL